MSALVHGIRILRLFSEERPLLSLSEISRQLGISKSNTHRILSILVEERMLDKTHSGLYRLGLALFELGSLSASHTLLEQVARPVMTTLVRQVPETVHLGILDGVDVVYLQMIESPYNLRISTRAGGRGPAYCTSTGKAILAFQREELVQAVIAAGLRRFTEKTIVDPNRLVQHLQQVRELGYATCDEEMDPGVRAVAAPIRNGRGEVCSAVSLVGPATRFTHQRLNAATALVVDAARTISLELGYDPRAQRTAARG